MKLRIQDPDHEFEQSFYIYLRNSLQQYMMNTIDKRKLVPWDTYFNKSLEFNNYRSGIVHTYSALNIATSYLVIKDIPEGKLIQFNENVQHPNFNQLKVIQFCKLINYGNQTINGYPLFTDAFKHFANCFDMYLDKYRNENQ